MSPLLFTRQSSTRKSNAPTYILLPLLTLIAAFLRFYNLTFDSPWWFHPDERTIPGAIVEISTEQPLSKLFTYGGLPVYLNFFILTLVKKILTLGDPFPVALIIGRLESAFLSSLLIPLMWKLTKDWWGKPAAWTSALLTAFCVGFIQFAHFGTYEIWLTFQSLILLILAIKLINTHRFLLLLLVTGLIWGLSIATKINQLVFAPGIFLALFLRNLPQPTTSKTNLKLLTATLHFALRTLHSFIQFLPLLIISLTVWTLTNPHILADQSKFLSMLDYEGGLARGQIITFYTRQFIDTIPLIFQATKVFPWILSWPTFLLGTTGLLAMLLTGLKSLLPSIKPPRLDTFKNTHENPSPGVDTIIKNRQFLVSCFLLLVPLWAFLQLATIGTLYVKWTRYLIPTLPYFILAAVWLIHQLPDDKPQGLHTSSLTNMDASPGVKGIKLRHVICSVLIATQALWTLAFFSIYTRPDPRITAANWAQDNLDPQAYTLSEVYDMGITVFAPHMNNIHLFNFYELDDPGHRPTRKQQLQEHLAKTQVIIVNSRRIWKNALDHPDQFPLAAQFYTQLFDGSLGFTKIADFANFPRLGPLVFNTETLAEETFSVFDHPHVMIFQRSSTRPSL